MEIIITAAACVSLSLSSTFGVLFIVTNGFQNKDA